MDAASPVFAALGVAGFDALNDLAHWLDNPEPATAAESAGWAGGWIDQVFRAAAGAASGREG